MTYRTQPSAGPTRSIDSRCCYFWIMSFFFLVFVYTFLFFSGKVQCKEVTKLCVYIRPCTNRKKKTLSQTCFFLTFSMKVLFSRRTCLPFLLFHAPSARERIRCFFFGGFSQHAFCGARDRTRYPERVLATGDAIPAAKGKPKRPLSLLALHKDAAA